MLCCNPRSIPTDIETDVLESAAQGEEGGGGGVHKSGMSSSCVVTIPADPCDRKGVEEEGSRPAGQAQEFPRFDVEVPMQNGACYVPMEEKSRIAKTSYPWAMPAPIRCRGYASLCPMIDATQQPGAFWCHHHDDR
jgi:hypothetical protein